MTSIKNNQAILKRGLSTLTLSLVVLSLSACGGKKVSTNDNSVDYRSAQSLPPLKKPSRVVIEPTQAPTIEPQVAITEPSVVDESVEESAEQIIEEATALENVNAEASVQTSEPILAPEPAVEPIVEPSETVEAESPVLSASVVTAKSGQARLEVAAEFDQAWEYLSSSLQKSDLTIFSRNKAAGRFSIGCANIAAAPTVVKSGRWSFFNRDKQENLEYCALQAIEKRGTTIVSVLNRAGEEVSGEYSNQVFSRILNN